MNDVAISPVLLLIMYSGLILVASLAGGWVPLFVRLTHTRLQLATSFVSGLMLGVGVLHLLPHSWQELHSIDQAASWMLGGFLVMFFVQRFFHFHHHDVPDEPQRQDADGSEESEAEHGHAPAHRHGPECAGHSLAEQSARRLSWSGAALGLMFHSVLDGVALAASVEVGAATGALLGLGTFLVIFLHKPFDSLAIGTLLARSGGSRSLHHWVNGLFALGIPAGVLLFQLGASAGLEGFVGYALAFAAGTFLCIAASDLLPELQFHEHDRLKLSAALVAGLALSAAIGHLEHGGHDAHEQEPPAAITNP